MFSLKFVLVAILIFLGCALAQSLQGEEVVSDVAESTVEVVKDEAERWRWHEDNEREENNNEEREVAEVEVVEVVSNKKRAYFPPCSPPKGTTPRPTVAPTTRPPPTAPTTRPTNPPSTRPPTNPPTTKPTNPPTVRPTNPPTTKPTNPPTVRPTNPPTTKPTNPPTVRPTNPPTTKPTNPPTVRPTNPPSTSGSTSGSNYGLCDVVPTSVEPLKMLLPLYVYPGSSWDQIISNAGKIDIIAIINPNSGPGSSPSSTYTSYMNKLNTAGVEQVGYVYTKYGDRSISEVKADIDIYVRSFPHVKGIFFDEASNSASDIPYYRELYNYVVSKGYSHSILNPGVTPAQGYVDISTNIVVFEDYGSSVNSKSYSSFVKCAPSASQKAGYKYKFSGIAHTTSLSNVASYIQKFRDSGLGLVYVTDGAGGCCTYNNMPSYFASEVTAIQSFN